MVATRNDGHPKKSEAPMLSDIRCASRSIERLARTHACGDRVAKKWRAGGGGAEKIPGGGACVYVLPPPFPPAQAISAGALLRHRRVANQP